MERSIIGLGGCDHDCSAALVEDATLVAVSEEERFSRIKHQGGRHTASLTSCLSRCTVGSLPSLAFAFSDRAVIDQVHSALCTSEIYSDLALIPVDHHLSHAVTAHALSGFEDSLVLTVDGQGDGVSTSAWKVTEKAANQIWSIPFPHSIGTLWMSVCYLLGFGMRDAGKLMGLAPYGRPCYEDVLLNAVTLYPDGRYAFNIERHGPQAFLHSTQSLFRCVLPSPRAATEPLVQVHMDIAASLQSATETIVLHALAQLSATTGLRNLCLAGGVALNSVLNGRILRTKMFDRVYVPPNPGDSGTAIGSAICVAGRTTLKKPNCTAFLGSESTSEIIESTLVKSSYKFSRHENITEVAAKLLESGHVLGWFQGRSEMGPRALGNRSILADPRRVDIRDIVNSRVKHREWFRPFAPVVIEERTTEWFDLNCPSPFMSFVCPVLSQRQQQLPAVTHVDGSGRVQTVTSIENPRLYSLLEQFEALTGVPVLLNTSFNVMGEPIVDSPEDALRCLCKTDLSYLVMDTFLIPKPR